MPIVVTTGGSGGDGAVSGGDADTVDGRHASEFALLTGATFSGRIGAPAVYMGAPGDARGVDDGVRGYAIGGRSGVWSCDVQGGSGRVTYRWGASLGEGAKYLADGEPAAEWRCHSSADGYGMIVRAAAGGAAGAAVQWSDIMAATLDGIALRRDVTMKRMCIGLAGPRTQSLVEIRGYTSSWAINVQDGSGRANVRWNASAGRNPEFVVGGGEQAVEWDMDGWGSMGLSVRQASSSGKRAGDPITWTNIMSAGVWGVWIGVPLRLRSYAVADLPPADRGMGMVCYVTDGPAGPCLAVSDGSAWRQVALGDVL